VVDTREIIGGTSFNSLLAVYRLSYIGFGENIAGKNAMETEKVASHFTAKIVRSYVRHHTVGAAQISSRQYTGRSVSLDSPTIQRRFALPLCPCDAPYTRTMWFAWIVVTGAKRYAGTLAHGTI
jgi:hypothetical protein